MKEKEDTNEKIDKNREKRGEIWFCRRVKKGRGRKKDGREEEEREVEERGEKKGETNN